MRLPFGYSLDRSDPDVLVLLCPQGAGVLPQTILSLRLTASDFQHYEQAHDGSQGVLTPSWIV